MARSEWTRAREAPHGREGAASHIDGPQSSSAAQAGIIVVHAAGGSSTASEAAATTTNAATAATTSCYEAATAALFAGGAATTAASTSTKHTCPDKPTTGRDRRFWAGSALPAAAATRECGADDAYCWDDSDLPASSEDLTFSSSSAELQQSDSLTRYQHLAASATSELQ